MKKKPLEFSTPTSPRRMPTRRCCPMLSPVVPPPPPPPHPAAHHEIVHPMETAIDSIAQYLVPFAVGTLPKDLFRGLQPFACGPDRGQRRLFYFGIHPRNRCGNIRVLPLVLCPRSFFFQFFPVGIHCTRVDVPRIQIVAHQIPPKPVQSSMDVHVVHACRDRFSVLYTVLY